MQKWEYYTFRAEAFGEYKTRDRNNKKVTFATSEYQNSLGELGWELVAVTKRTDNAFSHEHYYFYKRLLPE